MSITELFTARRQRFLHRLLKCLLASNNDTTLRMYTLQGKLRTSIDQEVCCSRAMKRKIPLAYHVAWQRGFGEAAQVLNPTIPIDMQWDSHGAHRTHEDQDVECVKLQKRNGLILRLHATAPPPVQCTHHCRPGIHTDPQERHFQWIPRNDNLPTLTDSQWTI